MPDHLHSLISFPHDHAMSEVIRNWKRFHTRTHAVIWQEDFFDHRLRDDERGEQLSAKVEYIRNNPVAAGLCESAQDWPRMIDKSASLE
jgi:putative transposase